MITDRLNFDTVNTSLTAAAMETTFAGIQGFITGVAEGASTEIGERAYDKVTEERGDSLNAFKNSLYFGF